MGWSRKNVLTVQLPLARTTAVQPSVAHPPEYDSLIRILMDAALQAHAGKGTTRHTLPGQHKPFENQQIMDIARNLGSNHYHLGQAIKKCMESVLLDDKRSIEELKGAIVYIAAAILFIERAGK